jgi:hypothetical protein
LRADAANKTGGMEADDALFREEAFEVYRADIAL